MAQAAQKFPGELENGSSAAGRAGNPTDWSVGWSSLFWGSALVMGANIFLWFWDYEFAFTAGLNSASREFTGRFCIDEEVLRSAGVQDFSVYRHEGVREEDLLPDFFV